MTDELKLKDWLERAFDAGSNHFAYHESNRSEYSPDFQEWYEHYKGHLKSPSLVNDELLQALKAVSDWWFKQRGGIFPFKQVEDAIQKAEQTSRPPDDDIIPEDYYIK